MIKAWRGVRVSCPAGLAPGVAPGVAVAWRISRICTDFGSVDQEFRIARQVVDAGGVAAGEAGHRLDALPIGDGHELGSRRRGPRAGAWTPSAFSISGFTPTS